MNKIAANPLMITTGMYWLMESSTAGDCLAKTGARKPKFPVTAMGASAHLLGFRDGSAGLDRMADRNRALCESRRRPRLGRLSALAETGRLEFAPFS